MNTNLTAANEKEVFALIQNSKAKTRWQAISAISGKTKADRMVAEENGINIKTVKAARYYW